MTPIPMITDADRFRKAPPVIELTPEAIAELRRLLDEVQKHASVTGLPWRREASSGKPLLCANKETRGCCIAYGTIGSWNEIDLAVAAVNALPAFLAMHAASQPADDVVEQRDREFAGEIMRYMVGKDTLWWGAIKRGERDDHGLVQMVSAFRAAISQQPNRELEAMLPEIRADIDYACAAIMKLHEHKARARLEQTLIRIDAALSKEPGR